MKTLPTENLEIHLLALRDAADAALVELEKIKSKAPPAHQKQVDAVAAHLARLQKTINRRKTKPAGANCGPSITKYKKQRYEKSERDWNQLREMETGIINSLPKSRQAYSGGKGNTSTLPRTYISG